MPTNRAIRELETMHLDMALKFQEFCEWMERTRRDIQRMEREARDE